MNITRAATKLFSAKLASQFIGFLGLIFFARELGAEQMGIFFLFQAVLSILALPADIGVREGIEKRISEGKDSEKFLTTGLALKLGFSAILSIGLLLTQNIINEYIGGQVTLLLIIALILNALSEVAIRTLKGELRVGEIASLQFARQFVWIGVGAIFVWMGFGYIALIYSLLLGYGIVFLWGMHKRSTEFGPISRDHANSLWAYSKYSFIGAVGGSFYSWMDVIIIGYFLPQTHVGAYEMAWRIGIVVTLLSSAIGKTIFPQVSEWDVKGEKDQIEALIPNVLTPSLFLVIPAFFGSLLLSHDILEILFGEDFTIAWVVLIIFMAINFVSASSGIFAKILRGINHPRLAAKARLISLCINLILNIILVWQVGIVGGAVATGIALTVYTVLIIIYLNRHINIRFPYYEIGWCLIASFGMIIIIAGITSIVNINTISKLFAIVGLGAMIYFVIVMAYTPLRSKLLRSIRQLL